MQTDLRGYTREPTLNGDRIVFVCESDLWEVTTEGGNARRLTAHTLDASSPFLSPDGRWLAFVAREEGASEVYVMPSAGGPARRLTHLGQPSVVTGWSPDGERVLFASMAGQPFRRGYRQWSVPREGGPAELQPFGPADRISHGPGGGVVIGRNVGDPARWKRYRGGTAGDLWIDRAGNGEFSRLIRLQGNLANPMWVGERVYFLSDHEGHGNLYSCTPDGEGLARHTHHEDFYARNATTDGRRIVYQQGADLHLFDPTTGEAGPLEVTVASTRPQLVRRFVGAADFLEEARLHPKGHKLLLVARGKAFSMGNWEREVVQHGVPDGVRHRLARWLPDGERLVLVSDAGGEEALEVHAAKAPLTAPGTAPERRLDEVDIGRPHLLEVSPVADQVVLANQRQELIWVDLASGATRVLDRSEHGRIGGIAWSPDGRFVAYGFQLSRHTSHIRLAEVATGEVHPVTRPVHADHSPCFDPQGRYLYFVSYRTFDPVYDRMHFDLGFPRGGKLYLVTLRDDLESPFHPTPRPFDAGGGQGGDKASEADKTEGAKAEGGDEAGDEGPKPVRIDLEGIADRVLAFPIEEGVYGQVAALPDRVLYDRWPIQGALAGAGWHADEPPKGRLLSYDLTALKEEPWVEGFSDFSLSGDGKALLYRVGKRLRVVPSSAKPDPKPEAGDAPGRASGYIDLQRPRISVVPAAEWRQMYREAWRLQRDNFWNPDMSEVDWQGVHDRYLKVLERVATRTEFSDLMWEVQGELGTSHAYEIGGDLRTPPPHAPGQLGADLAFQDGRWVIVHRVRGDSWVPGASSPLAAPGLGLAEGDAILAIDGQPLDAHTSPGRALVNRAGVDVVLTVQRGQDAPRAVTVRTLTDESQARYREWVEANRERVHHESGGRVGYVHVPDMGPRGFSEFHRYYLQEVSREALIVDVRYNGGGHVSQLLLEKLARRRLGYDIPRYGKPIPYPEDSVLGPIVGLTNEHAGSDGDIFSHCFKLMKLGPLVGKRTWGGVVGIWPRHPLVDRTITTQAEFAFWFEDVGWSVENYGTDPDIEVDIRPQDWAAGRDPQLQEALDTMARLLEETRPAVPDFGPRPSMRPPRLKI